jgi:hypothetical protein
VLIGARRAARSAAIDPVTEIRGVGTHKKEYFAEMQLTDIQGSADLGCWQDGIGTLCCNLLCGV